MQSRYAFAKGDTLHCRGYITERHGALVLRTVRAVEVADRGEPCFWTTGRALVAQRTGSILAVQPEKCHACEKGILLEVRSEEQGGERARRTMFCLEGIQDPEWCSYHVLESVRKDSWPESPSCCDAP